MEDKTYRIIVAVAGIVLISLATMLYQFDSEVLMLAIGAILALVAPDALNKLDGA